MQNYFCEVLGGKAGEELVQRTEKRQNQWLWKGRVGGVLRAFTVVALVAVQVLFIFELANWLSEATVYYYAIVEIASFLIILSLVNDNRSDSYKIAWISLVMLMPVSGHIMYLLWGEKRQSRREKEQYNTVYREYLEHCELQEGMVEEYEKTYPTQARMARYLENRHFPLCRNNRVTYYPMGEDAFEAIFEDIAEARQYVFVNFFIVAEGRLFERMWELMRQKVQEGVEVLFLYDDFGTMFRTSEDTLEQMREQGIQIHVFNPIHSYVDKLYMNYRSHQKMVVIDGEIAYTGGINLADEYTNIIQRFGTWKDTAVRLRGEVAWHVAREFLQMWNATTKGDEPKQYPEHKPNAIFAENATYCQFFIDGPTVEEQTAQYVYMQMIGSAKRRLYITTPYLILDQQMKQMLCYAAKSGIDVRIITPGIPDKKMVKILTNYNYGILLRAGVRIYEYQPGFIHSKVILNDDSVLVGTINMDYRSFYLHYEDAVVISEEKSVEAVKADFMATLEESKQITYSMWQKRPYLWKLIQPFLNLYATLM